MTRTKRYEVPGFWPIEKKNKLYTVSLIPGTHSKENAITLAVIVRDMLKYAENMREVKQILNSRVVRVNGKVRREPGFPVGIMDVVSLGEESYRLLPSKDGFNLIRINEKESSVILKKIKNKTTIKKGKTQLNFHDGTTAIAEGNYSTGDVIVFDPDMKIKEVIKQDKDTLVLITKGNNRGLVGRLEKINIVKSPEPNIAEISYEERKIVVPLDFIFAVGSKNPIISLGDKNE